MPGERRIKKIRKNTWQKLPQITDIKRLHGKKNYGYKKTAQKKLATDIKKLQGKKITLKTSLKSIVEKKVWSGRSL